MDTKTEQTEQTGQKRVLITGCSSGFGLLTAVRAALAGYDVIATIRNPAKSEGLRSALNRAGARATIEALDVTDERSIGVIVEKYSPVDILVNNAGFLIMGSFLDISHAESRGVLETNYFGAVRLTRAVVPAMIQRRSGIIINVASLAGIVGHPFNAAYAASKGALIGFSQSIRLELAPFNIKVACVEPGYHKTEIIGVNANLCENFYDRSSPTFEYNRGFLRLMMDRIIPRAAPPEAVADKILRIMRTENPKTHYVIGRDARFAKASLWLGLGSWLEKKVIDKLSTATRRENRKELARKTKRSRKTAGD